MTGAREYLFAQRWGVAAIVTLPVGFVALLTLLPWPEWWKWVIFERTPMTWLQSVLLLACAAFSALSLLPGLFELPRREVLARLFMTCSFLALTLDERFALHERLRDRLLAPQDIGFPLFPWVEPGNFVLLLALIVFLALLPWLRRAYATGWPRRLFLIAVALAVAPVGMDSLDVHEWSLGAQRLQQYLEELLEMSVMLVLLVAGYRDWLERYRQSF